MTPEVFEKMRAKFSVIGEVDRELARAAAKYPDCVKLPDGTGGTGRKTYETMARNSCERAYREKRLTHAHVFEEEVAEALAAEDQASLRKELLQVASVCLGWILDIDSRPKDSIRASEETEAAPGNDSIPRGSASNVPALTRNPAPGAGEVDWSRFVPTTEIPLAYVNAWASLHGQEGAVFCSMNERGNASVRMWNKHPSLAGSDIWDSDRWKLIRHADGRWAEGFHPGGPCKPTCGEAGHGWIKHQWPVAYEVVGVPRGVPAGDASKPVFCSEFCRARYVKDSTKTEQAENATVRAAGTAPAPAVPVCEPWCGELCPDDNMEAVLERAVMVIPGAPRWACSTLCSDLGYSANPTTPAPAPATSGPTVVERCSCSEAAHYREALRRIEKEGPSDDDAMTSLINCMEIAAHALRLESLDEQLTCDTPGCGRPIPIGGEGSPEVCPKCLDDEGVAQAPGPRLELTRLGLARIAIDSAAADIQTALDAWQEENGGINDYPGGDVDVCLEPDADSVGFVAIFEYGEFVGPPLKSILDRMTPIFLKHGIASATVLGTNIDPGFVQGFHSAAPPPGHAPPPPPPPPPPTCDHKTNAKCVEPGGCTEVREMREMVDLANADLDDNGPSGNAADHEAWMRGESPRALPVGYVLGPGWRVLIETRTWCDQHRKFPVVSKYSHAEESRRSCVDCAIGMGALVPEVRVEPLRAQLAEMERKHLGAEQAAATANEALRFYKQQFDHERTEVTRLAAALLKAQLEAAGWQSQHAVAKEDADGLRAKVEKLEALFQRTHGCHWSWVEKAEAADARVVAAVAAERERCLLHAQDLGQKAGVTEGLRLVIYGIRSGEPAPAVKP